MREFGYLYVLANSSMPGFSKVGKTTRNPTERAVELSGVTGLPTPFIVVYEQLFQDCGAAESFVHTFLAQNGYRVSDNREFFNAPVNVIIRAIALAPGVIDNITPQSEQETSDELLTSSNSDELDSLQLQYEAPIPPWLGSFEEAEAHYYGLGDYIQDYNEALRLFRQSATLGCLPAYGYIGNMYADGEGVREDKKKALDFYKEGARKGSAYCYWAMGMLFAAENSTDNAEKCFSLYLKNIPSSFPDSQKLTEIQLSDVFRGCVKILYDNLFNSKNTLPILRDFIATNSAEIQNRAQKLADFSHEQNHSGLEDRYKHIVQYLASMATSPTA